LIINVFGKRIRNISRDSQQSWGALNDVLEESIRSQKVIKIFEGAAYETRRFDTVANRIRRNAMRHAVAAAASTPFTHLIVSIAIALIVYLAASPQYGTGMEVSEFVSYIVAAAGLVPQIKGLSGVSEQMQRGMAAAESVFGLIDEAPEQDHGRIDMPRAEGRLCFENVSLQYASQPIPALDQVSLDIQPGETIALVGASGGGKTSLVNLVPRFFLPSAGRITLDGHALDDIKLTDLRRQIALVSQDVVLFNDTVSANIAYGKQGTSTQSEIEDAATAAHCLDFIRALPQGFDTIIGENGALLSGGQRQRLAIARALIKNAPILLLDEATSALDSESERQVQAALQTLMRGRTTIVVAHRLSTIENADRIVVMGHGRILEVGSHAALSAQGGVYASLHRLQFENV
jgi:subfamily B ATP-binding cassette protein MsbA